ncbi:DUF1398 domain-containing protein [Tardiphaga alba]|uniref:DUF1398 domain-containing protein n=1 Tax=Tardiphaga alba TaxID=340268 RepID=A0ABX8AFG1_9BRAD|nr:DUF1398 family protein [Tardiphaga alba]QUS41148.1 DUF1398 domain-containing protein [Tardiphaga alba]
MTQELTDIAARCLHGSENNTMPFPVVVQTLAAAGFESYSIDFRKSEATYYLPDGTSITIPADSSNTNITATFDAESVNAAIKEAQALVPGYTYKGFCDKVRAAGCAGYMVSFSGHRAMYYGRTGETHTEMFPNR